MKRKEGKLATKCQSYLSVAQYRLALPACSSRFHGGDEARRGQFALWQAVHEQIPTGGQYHLREPFRAPDHGEL